MFLKCAVLGTVQPQVLLQGGPALVSSSRLEAAFGTALGRFRSVVFGASLTRPRALLQSLTLLTTADYVKLCTRAQSRPQEEEVPRWSITCVRAPCYIAAPDSKALSDHRRALVVLTAAPHILKSL